MDKVEIIKFIISDWLRIENEAYARLLSDRNRYISQLQEHIQTLARANMRLQNEERVLYNHANEPVIFRRNELGHWVEVFPVESDTDDEPVGRRVRRRLTYDISDSDSDTDSDTDMSVGLWASP